MNSPPHRDQPLPLALDLLHHPAQIASADADDPIEPDIARFLQDDLRFAALSEHVHMRRSIARTSAVTNASWLEHDEAFGELLSVLRHEIDYHGRQVGAGRRGKAQQDHPRHWL